MGSESSAGELLGLVPIARRKLSDEVFDKLMGLIESGQLKPGDHVPSERKIMETLRVGRPAVREAMQALATKGLIEIAQGERSRVATLSARSVIRQVDIAAKMLLSGSPASLEELKSTRLLFERGVIREAASKATAADLAGLRDAILMQRQALGSPASFVAADMAFHTRIARITGNSIFGAVSEAMLDWLMQFHTELLHWSGNEDVTLSEHEDIVRSMEAGDADAAEASLVRHLERSRSLYAFRE